MKKIMLITLLPLMLQSIACADNAEYQHDKWVTQPQDHTFTFEAFVTSFDGIDDNNGNKKPDIWGIPEWVAFEIRGQQPKDPLTKRPKWTTDKELAKEGIAPTDATYAVSGTRSMSEVKGDYRFVRGHMCPKDTAERISANAAYETHSMLNAVPQLQWQNNGIWKTLESLCVDWADKYGQVWVICGPVFFAKNPAMWLGQDGEKQAAIPDALYKIVIRQEGDQIKTLAFLIPNILPKSEQDLNKFLVSIDRLESLTGLDFLTALEDQKEAAVEKSQEKTITWEVLQSL